MSSDYELSDNDMGSSDEEMIDGTQDDQGELKPPKGSTSSVYVRD